MNIGRAIKKIPAFFAFAAFLLWELVVSSLRIAWDVLTPRAYRSPGIIAVPLRAETDSEVAMVANFITLTPGSLSVDAIRDPETNAVTLYVHSMFAGDPDELRQSLQEGFERRVLELMR